MAELVNAMVTVLHLSNGRDPSGVGFKLLAFLLFVLDRQPGVHFSRDPS